MKYYILVFLASLTFLGCKDEVTNTSNYAYFGGEVINPKNDYVVIGKSGKELDTLYLNNENRFNTKIEDLNPGLYTFKHGDEYQIVFLEPNDSIMFRLNTVDFDDSLVFTGIGSKKNNILVGIFLENETESKKRSENFQIEPEKFVMHLDSCRTSRINDLEESLLLKPQSEAFKLVAEASINYHYYGIKEIYPFGYFGNNNLIHFDDLPEHFYDFRNNIDYNNYELSEVFAYNSFLFSHFNNLALEKYYVKNDHNISFNRKSVSFCLAKLHLMDSLVKTNEIKNYLLNYTTRDFIFSNKNKHDIDEVVQSFYSKCTSNDYKKSIEDLIVNIEKTSPGHKFPGVEVINYDSKTHNLNSILTKPTVIYFWSSAYKMHNRNTHFQIKNLRAKYPNIDFFAINVGNDDIKYWKNIVGQLKSPQQYEFKFKNSNEATKTLVLNTVNKVFIIDGKKKIVSSNLNMFNDNFETVLKKLNP